MAANFCVLIWFCGYFFVLLLFSGGANSIFLLFVYLTPVTTVIKGVSKAKEQGKGKAVCGVWVFHHRDLHNPQHLKHYDVHTIRSHLHVQVPNS